MTREQTLDTMGATLDDWVDRQNMHMLIDKIYDDFEEELKKAYIEGNNYGWKQCREFYRTRDEE